MRLEHKSCYTNWMIVRCADTGLVPPARGVMVRAAALPAGFRTVNAELTEAVSTRIGLFSEVNTDLSGRRGLPKLLRGNAQTIVTAGGPTSSDPPQAAAHLPLNRSLWSLGKALDTPLFSLTPNP